MAVKALIPSEDCYSMSWICQLSVPCMRCINGNPGVEKPKTNLPAIEKIIRSVLVDPHVRVCMHACLPLSLSLSSVLILNPLFYFMQISLLFCLFTAFFRFLEF